MPNQSKYFISTKLKDVDVNLVHKFLCYDSYWANGLSMAVVQKSIENSRCYSVLDNENNMVGFARVVTDYATFGYLCDLFIEESYRGGGLSKKLVEFIVNDLKGFGLRSVALNTKDAHTLYAKFGFKVFDKPENYMVLKFINSYLEE